MVQVCGFGHQDTLSIFCITRRASAGLEVEATSKGTSSEDTTVHNLV